MQKTKIELDYDLKNASVTTVWNVIGTPLGMIDWFADDVKTESDNLTYIFSWYEHKQTAKRIANKPLNYVRFQWEEDAETEYYFELQITENELTGNVMLHITDFADSENRDDTILLWKKNIEEMMRKFGL
jgi:hypothetical protein